MPAPHHSPQVADYYVEQSKAVHHGVREAACACIAELAEKVRALTLSLSLSHSLTLTLTLLHTAWAGTPCRACV